MASSSDPVYSSNYDKYGDPTDRNRVGGGSSLLLPLYWDDYKVSVDGGHQFIERRYNDGSVYRSEDGSHWTKIK